MKASLTCNEEDVYFTGFLPGIPFIYILTFHISVVGEIHSLNFSN